MVEFTLSEGQGLGVSGAVKPITINNGNQTYQATITGTPTAVTVVIEGSLDGTNYTAINTHAFTAGELTATFAMFSVIDNPVSYIRANVTVLTGGTAPTVSVIGIST